MPRWALCKNLHDAHVQSRGIYYSTEELKPMKVIIHISFVANTCVHEFRPTLHLHLLLTSLKVTVYLQDELRRAEGRPSNAGPSCCCVFLSANTHTDGHALRHPSVFTLTEGTCH